MYGKGRDARFNKFTPNIATSHRLIFINCSRTSSITCKRYCTFWNGFSELTKLFGRAQVHSDKEVDVEHPYTNTSTTHLLYTMV